MIRSFIRWLVFQFVDVNDFVEMIDNAVEISVAKYTGRVRSEASRIVDERVKAIIKLDKSSDYIVVIPSSVNDGDYLAFVEFFEKAGVEDCLIIQSDDFNIIRME